MTETAKERPILFSAPMVLALLDGRKTQTRRVVKPQPERSEVAPHCERGWWMWRVWTPEHAAHGFPSVRTGDCRCPYGESGDRLWVREACKQRALPNLLTGKPTNAMCAVYAADFEPVLNDRGFDYAWWYSRPTCPGIHMPRFACRLVLEVKAVRVERLQDISEADAEAEGVDRIKAKVPLHRDAYRYLWEDISGLGEWEKNPWVWVVEFKRTAESAMAIAA